MATAGRTNAGRETEIASRTGVIGVIGDLRISTRGFANCTSLESISIPGTVTEVGTTQNQDEENLPFYGCTALKSVRFEDGSSYIYLGVYYYGSYSDPEVLGLFSSSPLEEVYIGRNIKYKDYISSYTFASYPKRYGYSAFYNQSKLAKVTIGANVSTIQQYAFYKCGALTTV